MSVGELFIPGFFGKAVPVWTRDFADRYGLGGIILFDYSCQTRQYDNNIESSEQLRPCAGRFRRCRPIPWCSSTRKAA